MKPTQFIKDHGLEKARKVVEGAPEWAMSINFNNGMYYSRMEHKKGDTFLYDIKRIVESVDLIKKHGGLFSTKCQLDKGGSHYEWYGENGDYGLTDLEDLEQAIADYESIYGGEHV